MGPASVPHVNPDFFKVREAVGKVGAVGGGDRWATAS